MFNNLLLTLRPTIRARLIWSLAVVALGIILVRLSYPASTQYHMREFLYSITSTPQPFSWRDRFRRDYVEWMLRGRPTDAQLSERAVDHERELLARGVFVRRQFVLRHRPPSEQTFRGIAAILTRVGSDRKWRMWFHKRSPRFIITATPANMRLFEAAVREYDDSPGSGTEIKGWPNHALQRTAASRCCSNRRASWPPSLSLGR